MVQCFALWSEIALVWPDEESQESTQETIAVRVNRLTGNPCNLLHYTAEEFDNLPERAPELYVALESEGIDLIGALAR